MRHSWVLRTSVGLLQALCRGYLVRQKLFAMLQHYYEREHLVIKCQSIWRARRARQRFRQLVRTKVDRHGRDKQRWLAAYRPHVDKIVKIQRAWRYHKSRADFQSLLLNSGGTVGVTQVRKYLHLVDLSREDFEQELELQNLKGVYFVRITTSSIFLMVAHELCLPPTQVISTK